MRNLRRCDAGWTCNLSTSSECPPPGKQVLVVVLDEERHIAVSGHRLNLYAFDAVTTVRNKKAHRNSFNLKPV
ncbi:MAG: hypothetical protein GY822_14595 [Deltaproteobacteria bacterium]|nr:hypothetical protein [Deltaproteobacteria bacterium]